MEVTAILSINDICRVCLTPINSPSSGSDLFAIESNTVQLWTKMMACALVQVFQSDGLPGLICNKCHNNLEVAYNFKLQCESTDIHLRQILGLPVNSNCTENRKEYAHVQYSNNIYFHNEESTKTLDINKRSDSNDNDRNSRISEKTTTQSDNDEILNLNLRQNYGEIIININQVQHSGTNSSKSNNSANEVENPINQSKSTLICHDPDCKDTHATSCLQKPKKNCTKYADKTSPQKNQCEVCGKLFKSLSHMTQHRRIHMQKKVHECDICHHKFSSCSNLIIHARVHSGERPFICQVCGKGFMQSSGLTTHMRSHTGERPFKCEMCDKSFSQSSNLLIHKKIHSVQREHICQTCNKAFKFFKHLQSHMKLHTGIKDFICKICNKGFHRKSYLKVHMSIHRGERPYKCTYCGHGFSNSSNLTAHIRIHTGSKPFECQVCKKTFTQSSALNRHMHQHLSPSSNQVKPL